MKKQAFEIKSDRIKTEFLKIKREHPERLNRRIDMSWSNWMFGMEPLEDSARRLKQAGLKYVELHGNHYGPDLGYDYKEVGRILRDFDLKVSGVAALFSPDYDLTSISTESSI